MSNPTKTISVRVPVKYYDELKAYCSSKNKTMADVLLSNGFEKSVEVGLFEAPEPEANTSEFLMNVAGGSAAGILVYKAIKRSLPEGVYSKEQIEMYAIFSGLISSVIAGYGISNLSKALK